jgi:serine/threonine protein kinase
VTIHPESIGSLQGAGQDYNGAMIFTSSTKLGAYEIQSALGAGGTGNVYRALDTKLRRDVALKILRETFARDSHRFVRFEREGRLRASHAVVPRREHLAIRAKPEGMQFLGGCSSAMPLISVLPPLV